jgi:hypothetical protein
MRPTPFQKTPQISSIFKADSVTLHLSREKYEKLRLVYAPIDGAKVVLLGAALMAEADSGPLMTVVLTPYGSSMAIPLPPALPNS